MTAIHHALKTLAAIDTAIEADQGNAFRGWQAKILPTMADAYRSDETTTFRSHLGASQVGNDCGRALWYGFRWATDKAAPARMLRLWNRGHLEEGRLISMLLTIGCTVYQQDANGKQFRISAAGGHYGGSGDGVFSGCPDLPEGTYALSEFKTHNLKSFNKLAGDNWEEFYLHHSGRKPAAKPPTFKGEGMRSAKFEHWVQMQQYMTHMQLSVGVYFASCKDSDLLYAEVVQADPAAAARFTERGVGIVFAKEPPPRINSSPGWFGCRFCDHHAVCHTAAPPAVNCRTCCHSEPMPDGSWFCHHHVGPLDKATQLTGCSFWEKHFTAFR